MPQQIYIYGLVDPFTDKIRYIGKTNDLDSRLWGHINDAKNGQKSHRSNWIRQLLWEDIEPTVTVLEETTEDDWQRAEQDWIARALGAGMKLTNMTRGGDGLVGYVPSEETCRKLSEANKRSGKIPPSWKGRKQSTEHIRKRVEARKRNGTYKHTEETIQKIRKSRKGKGLGNTNTLGYKHTEGAKQKIRAASEGKNNPSYGKTPSEETKQKISKSKKGQGVGNQYAKGYKWTEEQKAGLRKAKEGKLGTPCAEETKEKLRIIGKEKWQDPAYRAKMQAAQTRRRERQRRRSEVTNDQLRPEES